MEIADSVEQLEAALERSRVGFKVERVKAAAAADQWYVVDGALQHRSRGFFSASGVQRGPDGDERLLLYQPQSAVTGLLAARIDGEYCFLLQARAEPGCLGEAQYGPTIQSTPANFMRLHGGASTPYVDAFITFDPNISLIDDTTQLDLGERYLFKTKRSILAETRAPSDPLPAFLWASRRAIADAVGKSAFLNIDLRSILSIAAWSGTGSGRLQPRSAQVRRSLDAPIRPQVVADLLTSSNPSEPATFISLEALANWQATEWGWSERLPRQGFDLAFFEVSARFREKGSWIQPLVDSATEGEAILACRDSGGLLEFFIRPLPEAGLTAGSALAPSYLRYPGAVSAVPAWLASGVPWSETTESDEGGRFYRDASKYRLVKVDGNAVASELGSWLRLSELKLLLSQSNLCTIQLRGIVSQLLGLADAST